MRKDIRANILVLFLLAGVSLMMPAAAGAQAPGGDAPAFAPIACSVEQPMAKTGDMLRMQAWVLTEGSDPVTYRWKVSAGKILGTGREVTWDLTGIEPGDKLASIQAVTKGKELSCTVEVRVLPSEGIKGETGSAFLVEGRKEVTGYGLYSYILLGSKPMDEESKKRSLAAFEAYLLGIESVQNLEGAGIPRHRLNVLYVPVKMLPGETKPTAQWILDNYDFARARVVLNSVSTEYRRGPYILSFDRPFFGLPKPSPSCIFQDLSPVPPQMVRLWAENFMAQAAQERHWEPNTSRQMITKTRTAVAVMAEGFGVARQAVTELITLKKDLNL